jgi:protein tyrosine/serine phosphatase
VLKWQGMKKTLFFKHFPPAFLIASIVVFSPILAFGSQPSPAFLSALQIIPNFQQVTPEGDIFRGGNPIDGPRGGEGITALAALGVKTDIDLQGGDVDGSVIGWISDQTEAGESTQMINAEAELATVNHIKFEPLPLDSHMRIGARAGAMIQHALEILGDPSRRPVFIHCEHGVDRTGLVIALYRVIYQNWKPADAKAEWVKSGHGFKNRLITGDLDVYFNKITKKLKR